MKFPKLEIENFLAIGKAELSFDGQGLVGVSADNKDDSSADSNGSGKSSIGDALAWCIWGSTARGVSGDDVVSWFVGKGEGTRVAVTIVDEDQTYKIIRHRAYPKHKHSLQLLMQENGAWVDLTKGTTTLTQKLVERLMGCSEEVFNAAVYSGQEAMPDIPGMTDKELKLLVEQAAGVDVLANAYDVARERARAVTEKRSQAQIATDRAVLRYTDASASLVTTEGNATAWVGQQAAKIAALKVDATQRTVVYKQALDAQTPDGHAQLDTAIAAVRARIDAVAAERQRETDLQSTYTTVNGAYMTSKGAVDRAQADLGRCTILADRVMDRVGSPCGECGKEVQKEDLAAVKTAADAKVTAATEELATRKVKLENAEKMLNDADETLVAHRDSMTDISGATAELANLNREKQILAAQDAEIARLKDQALNVAERWKAAEAETNPFEGMIAAAVANVTEREKQVEETKATLVACVEEESYAQAVIAVFAPAGVRARRLDEATPYLNQRTAHYLGSLADGSIEAFWTTLTETKDKKELREKFSVTVEKVSAGGKGSFKNLSGGEKRKVRLATSLALQDLVATRATKCIDLWIGDEIDDALDDAGIERLMGVLEEKARDRGTVIVISHNEIKDYCRRSLVVTKENDRATVLES